MRSHLAIACFGVLALHGCGTPAPPVAVKSSQQLADERLDSSIQYIREATAQGNAAGVGGGVINALGEGSGPARVVALFSSLPQAKTLYLSFLAKQSSEPQQSIEEARLLRYSIDRSRIGGLISAAQAEEFLERLSANLPDTIKLSLLDAANFALLSTSERRPRLADQSLAEFKAGTRRWQQLDALLQYIKEAGPDSAEGARVSTALLQSGIKREELPVIEQVLPALAARASESFAKATSTNPRDFLIAAGRVTSRKDVAAQLRSTGIYRPGMYGAIGGLVAGIIAYSGGTPAYHQYTIRENNGTEDAVDATAELKVGDCVEAYVEKAKAKEAPQFDDIRFVASSTCRP